MAYEARENFHRVSFLSFYTFLSHAVRTFCLMKTLEESRPFPFLGLHVLLELAMQKGRVISKISQVIPVVPKFLLQ